MSADMAGAVVIDRAGLDRLLAVLRDEGFRLVGPALRDGAIVYDDISSSADLPAGWTDEQEAGTYRLRRRADGALFGYNVGPQSWKRYLFPPSSLLWRGHRHDGGFTVTQDEPDGGETAGRFAFIGVRSCELHAIAIQDRVFLGGDHPDPVYAARRDGVFIVAVNCGQAGGTCFCVSMDTGPRARQGFDLALTELLGAGGHRFLVEVGSERGERVMGAVAGRPATAADVAESGQASERAAAMMGRTMDTAGIKDLLYENAEHPRWQDVASRCLSCGNCTMACPTCFCFRVEDVTDLAGEQVERHRSWDSCFTIDHSYLHGGAVRVSGASRYRQWMTHKLATWIDQFGTSGCVGCGRCVTWCPVGIDITEEAAAIRAAPLPRHDEEAAMDTLEPLLRRHEFFQGLSDDDVALLAGCAVNTRFAPGAFLAREGEPADRFFLLREGRVALEIGAPGRGLITVQTVGAGDVVGFSWLFPPHQWQFDARALQAVRAIALDGVCLRGKCDQEPRLGYDLMRRFARIAVERLQAARLQVMDVYGHAGAR